MEGGGRLCAGKQRASLTAMHRPCLREEWVAWVGLAPAAAPALRCVVEQAPEGASRSDWLEVAAALGAAGEALPEAVRPAPARPPTRGRLRKSARGDVDMLADLARAFQHVKTLCV